MTAPPCVPEWPVGTACVLSTGGGAPHAIPVSTAVRVSDSAVVLGLGARRESLRRLRAEPRCALTVLAGPDLAFTLLGVASVVADDVAGVVAVRLDVDAVQGHMTPDFTIAAGVDWRWTDDAAAARDAELRAALARLA